MTKIEPPIQSQLNLNNILTQPYEFLVIFCQIWKVYSIVKYDVNLLKSPLFVNIFVSIFVLNIYA